MTLSRKWIYLTLTLFAIALIAAGCAGTKPPTTTTTLEPAKAAADTKESVTIPAGAKPGQVTIMAYYPMNKDHKFIADYLVALGKKFPDKMIVEVNDMQSQEGRKKWQTTGLGCAGVFLNGKTRWEVLRDGKKENVDFIKRMGSFWDKADFEAVVKQLMADPSKTPVVPSAKGKPKKKPAAEGEGGGAGAQPAGAEGAKSGGK